MANISRGLVAQGVSAVEEETQVCTVKLVLNL